MSEDGTVAGPAAGPEDWIDPSEQAQREATPGPFFATSQS